MFVNVMTTNTNIGSRTNMTFLFHLLFLLGENQLSSVMVAPRNERALLRRVVLL